METKIDQTKQEQGTVTEQTYESLMTELGLVMKTMENSATSLEEQLINYEKGMRLCRELEVMLKSAEERITIINQSGTEETFE